MENVIEMRQVTKSYSDFKLDHIDLDIKKRIHHRLYWT